MSDGGKAMEPMGGNGKVVEVDEAYQGFKLGKPVKRGYAHHKDAIVSLVERGSEVRSFHVANITSEKLFALLAQNINSDTAVEPEPTCAVSNLGERLFAFRLAGERVHSFHDWNLE
jgi:hypothetical protein